MRSIQFSGVGFSYQPDDMEVVLKAMRSIQTLTQGPYQKEFEINFAEKYGFSHSFAVSSAAAAIELTATLFEIQPGDEVIAPAHTYCASVYPFTKRGAVVKWADIDPDEFLMDVESVKQLITPRTKVIIAVHLYGSPVDIDELKYIASSHDIFLLEDSAQSIGAEFRTRPAGTFGDIAVHSFHSHKNISTLGEGGMLSLNSDRWSELIPGLRHNGHRPFQIDPEKYWSPAMSDVDFDLEGIWPFNFCLGEVQSALGNHLLSKVESINAKRRERFLLANEVLGSSPFVKLQKVPNHKKSSHHLLPFQVVGLRYQEAADEVFAILSREFGVYPAKQYYPLYRYGLFSKSGNGFANVPITDAFYDNQVSLPFHYWMSDVDFEYLLDSTLIAIRRVAEKVAP